MLLSSLLAVLMTAFFSTAVQTRKSMGVRIEVQQGLRVLLSAISRELRQAGACLPETGQFIALDGNDASTADTLTLRIGQADPTTLVCLNATTTTNAASGTQELTVPNGTIFDDSHLVYVTPNGATGAYYTIASTTATTVTLTEPLAVTHPPNSGIYAVDERTYEIGTVSGREALTVALDGGSAYPLVDGVEAFNLKYHIGPCDTVGCASIVDLPADATEWRLVKKVVVSSTVKSYKEDEEGQFVYETGEITVRTRNFL